MVHLNYAVSLFNAGQTDRAREQFDRFEAKWTVSAPLLAFSVQPCMGVHDVIMCGSLLAIISLYRRAEFRNMQALSESARLGQDSDVKEQRDALAAALR